LSVCYQPNEQIQCIASESYQSDNNYVPISLSQGLTGTVFIFSIVGDFSDD